MAKSTEVTQSPEWQALLAHYQASHETEMRELFAKDPARAERFHVEALGIYLDYSKNRITDETVKALLTLAERSGLRAKIDAMFVGEKINTTEGRAVLHTALRAPAGASIVVDGKNVVPEVHAVLSKMAEFCERVRSGAWLGHTGKSIRNVVNIGIGGSDLGPYMATEALRHYSARHLTFRFVSNVDATDFAEATHSTRCCRASTPWTSISVPRRSHRTCRCCWPYSGFGTTTSTARKPSRSCPTTNIWLVSARTCSSWTWSPTANASLSRVIRSTIRPAQSFGASPVRMGSTPSTN